TASLLARRLMAPPFRDDRQPADVEHAQLADDAVAAAVSSRPAGAQPQLVALHPQRVLQLQRFDRRRLRVRPRDVYAARSIRMRTGALSAADRLVIREPLVAQRDVV